MLPRFIPTTGNLAAVTVALHWALFFAGYFFAVAFEQVAAGCLNIVSAVTA